MNFGRIKFDGLDVDMAESGVSNGDITTAEEIADKLRV